MSSIQTKSLQFLHLHTLVPSGGNLSSKIVEKSAEGILFSEEDIKRLIQHVALVNFN